MRTLFLSRILSTSTAQWPAFINDECKDIFRYDVLFLPFHAEGQWSLFMVLGCGRIKLYEKKSYNSVRPCIVHLQPSDWRTTRHHSASVADKIRTCLNVAWRDQNSEIDRLAMPFNKRSLPLCIPKGKCKFDERREAPRLLLTIYFFVSFLHVNSWYK